MSRQPAVAKPLGRGTAGLAEPSGRGSAGMAEPSSRQTASAAVQPSTRVRQQSAKPQGGKPVSRLAHASQSPVSSEEESSVSGSGSEEDDEEGSSEEEAEEDEDDSSEEGDQADGTERQQLAVDSLDRSSSQQGVDSDEYADDSPNTHVHGKLTPKAEAALQQQQQQQDGINNSASASFTRDDSSGHLMQRQHTEHMHVAVRTRPIPSGTSASCWIVDPDAATITLNATATAAKRKQAVYSSNTNALESGQSRGFLGTAPSTPGSGFWDSNAPVGTSMGYKFDQVLDKSAETAAVYSNCIQSLVHSAMEGVNGTVLAYGELTTASRMSSAVFWVALRQDSIMTYVCQAWRTHRMHRDTDCEDRLPQKETTCCAPTTTAVSWPAI